MSFNIKYFPSVSQFSLAQNGPKWPKTLGYRAIVRELRLRLILAQRQACVARQDIHRSPDSWAAGHFTNDTVGIFGLEKIWR